MSAVDQLFTELRAKGEKALMPFFTAGDPDIETTAALLRAVQDAGANLCEVGVPYSDPIADGPVIQASYQRALDSGFRLQQVFDMGKGLTDLRMPMVTMVSNRFTIQIPNHSLALPLNSNGLAPGAILSLNWISPIPQTGMVCL